MYMYMHSTHSHAHLSLWPVLLKYKPRRDALDLSRLLPLSGERRASPLLAHRGGREGPVGLGCLVVVERVRSEVVACCGGACHGLQGVRGAVVWRGEGGDCHWEEGVWVDWDHPHAYAGLREMWGSAGEGKLDRGNLMGEGDWNLCWSWWHLYRLMGVVDRNSREGTPGGQKS